MAWTHEIRAKAEELINSSLSEIAEIILGLEEKIEALEDEISDLNKQLEEQE